MKKVLVVAAHPDDEVLGAGGTILKHTGAGDEVTILLLGEGETSRGAAQADIEKRAAQAREAGQALGAKEVILEKFPDQKFDTVPLLELTKIVEAVIDRVKPEIVYTHNPMDLNLDHQLTAQAVLTACRPQPGFSVKQILAFEVLSSTEWQHKEKRKMFVPTAYVDISGVLDKKLAVLEVYRDELREFPHPRSLEGVRVLAKYRGMEAGLPLAEAFQVIRTLID